VQNAFRILVSDPAVQAVLINIFGGIARTDRIARGVVAALEQLGGVDAAGGRAPRGHQRRGGAAHPARGAVPVHRRRAHGAMPPKRSSPRAKGGV
jgi:succinyl-CoA synthetase beta subunit